MREKAHKFFYLLNESYRQDSAEKLQWIAIMSVPHMEKSDADELIASYRKGSMNILEELSVDTEANIIGKFKSLAE